MNQQLFSSIFEYFYILGLHNPCGTESHQLITTYPKSSTFMYSKPVTWLHIVTLKKTSICLILNLVMHCELPELQSELQASGNSPCPLPSLCHGYLCRSLFCLSLTPFFYIGVICLELYIAYLPLETMPHHCSSLSPSSEAFFFRCLYVEFKTRMHQRFMEKTIIVCSLVLSYQILFSFLMSSWLLLRTETELTDVTELNHSNPKVSFSSGKSCMKGPCPCFISHILQVNLASVHYYHFSANPTISFQKSPYKH